MSLFLAYSLEREGLLHNPGNIVDSGPPGSGPLEDPNTTSAHCITHSPKFSHMFRFHFLYYFCSISDL